MSQPQINAMTFKIVKKIDDANKEYIGITTRKRLCQVMSQYRTYYREYLAGKGYNNKLNRYIHESGGIENFAIYLIDTLSCSSKTELKAILQAKIDELKPELNETTTQSTPEVKDKIVRAREQHQVDDNNMITCICGLTYSKGLKQKHIKTTEHKTFMQLGFLTSEIEKKEVNHN